MKPTVYILTAVHNRLNETKKLLSSIKKQSYPNLRTFIVDDGSTDGTLQYLRRQKNLSVLEGDGNLWWTRSINRGLEEILKVSRKSDFVLIVNNDCTFDTDYVGRLVAFSQNIKYEIIGSLCVSQDGKKVIDAGINIDWANCKYVPIILKSGWQETLEVETNIDTLSTKGTLYKTSVFKSIGLFNDIAFPHYLSDYEFGCRAKLKGLKIAIYYKAIIYNKSNLTGLGHEHTLKKIHFKNALKLIFSRRSRLNIFDSINFIRLYCPPRYKFVNFVSLAKKMLGSLNKVYLYG